MNKLQTAALAVLGLGFVFLGLSVFFPINTFAALVFTAFAGAFAYLTWRQDKIDIVDTEIEVLRSTMAGVMAKTFESDQISTQIKAINDRIDGLDTKISFNR